MEQDPFVSFGTFGDHVFDGLGARDRSAQKFKYLLGVINNTLVTTHGMVISRLTALRQATTVDEAKVLLEKLRLVELSEAFRVEGLCDLLEGLGSGLYSRVSAAQYEGYFSGKELIDMQTFAMMLNDREDEIAKVYSTVLRDVTGQGRLLDQSSLQELQRKAAEVEILLTNQLSDFSEKANRFMRLSVSLDQVRSGHGRGVMEGLLQHAATAAATTQPPEPVLSGYKWKYDRRIEHS